MANIADLTEDARKAHAGHVLFEPSDFTEEEMDVRNSLAVAVCEGGLGVCKKCGAAESQLDDFSTCNEFKRAKAEKRA